MTDRTIESYDDQQRAAAYEHRWSAYLAHTHARFLEQIRTDGDDLLLDVSAGTGRLARELIEGGHAFRKLQLNEPSGAMRSVAARKLAGNPRIHITDHPARTIPGTENRFDRIFCLNAFHFYPQQQAVLRHFHELLKDGGRLCVLDWDRTGFFHIINRFIRWRVDEHIDTRSAVEMRSMLEGSGFSVTHTRRWRWRYWRLFYIEAAAVPHQH